MDHICKENCEQCEALLRLDAAIAALEFSSARLSSVTFSLSFDAIESAKTSYRLARMRLASAQAAFQDDLQTSY